MPHLRPLGAALVASLIAVAAPRPASACLNAVQLETKEAARLVAKVEAALDEGKPKKAYYLIPGELEVSDRALQRRLEVLQAVARLRIGHVTIALGMLAQHVKQRPDDPYLVARLAEAQTTAGKNLDEALARLVDLEKRDVMPDAEGWATLARLYDGKGDAAGRERAVARCKQIAKRAEVCAVGGKVASR